MNSLKHINKAKTAKVKHISAWEDRDQKCCEVPNISYPLYNG